MRIIDEVCALRGLQEELATARPDDPRRIFGEAVEASLNALQQSGLRGSLLEDSALSASRPASQPSRQQARFKLVYFFVPAGRQPARSPTKQPAKPASQVP